VQAEDETGGARNGAGRGLGGGAFDDLHRRARGVFNAEFVGFGYYVEIPAVIFDVQRWGPPRVSPRAPRRAIFFPPPCFHMATPNTPCCCLCSVTECFTMAIEAFDLAENLQDSGLCHVRP